MTEINVTKYTNIWMLHLANSFTSGKVSHMTLAEAYRTMHSPARTQRFIIEMRSIPLFVASQLVRSHVGVQFYQRSRRTDRGGEDFGRVCDGIARNLHAADSNSSWTLARKQLKEILSLPGRFDRYALTDLLADINAEAIVSMSHKRLCSKASPETRSIWQKVVEKLAAADADLAPHCVPQCVFRGGICPERKCCGFIHTEKGQTMLDGYRRIMDEQSEL